MGMTLYNNLVNSKGSGADTQAILEMYKASVDNHNNEKNRSRVQKNQDHSAVVNSKTFYDDKTLYSTD